MRVRYATKADIHRISMVYDQFRMAYDQGSDLERTASFLEEELNLNRSHVLVCEEGNECIGLLRYHTYIFGLTFNQVIYVTDLFVHAGHRGKKVSFRLLDELKSIAAGSHTLWITVGASKDDKRASHLYKEYGFILDEKTNFFSLSEY